MLWPKQITSLVIIQMTRCPAAADKKVAARNNLSLQSEKGSLPGG